jgi:hypothetical protein
LRAGSTGFVRHHFKTSSRRVQFPLRRQIDKAALVADHFRFYKFNPPGDRRKQ